MPVPYKTIQIHKHAMKYKYDNTLQCLGGMLGKAEADMSQLT